METMTPRLSALLLSITVMLLILILGQFVRQAAFVVWLLAVVVVAVALMISFRQQSLPNVLFATGVFVAALLAGYSWRVDLPFHRERRHRASSA